MKTRVYLLVLLLLLPALAFAQEEPELPFRQRFSLEVGTGVPPVQAILSPSSEARRALAKKGQEADASSVLYPNLTFSGVWRPMLHWEFTLTAGVVWSHYRVIQYGTFGTDPDGNPRYDLTEGTAAGWKASSPIPCVTFQIRYLWNPGKTLEAYSGIGLIVPEFTPLGLRFGRGRFYGFAECTLGGLATFAHGGVGMRL